MRPRGELQTPRLRLRALEPDDAADVFAYASDPVVTEFVEWPPHRSLADSLAFVERTQSACWHGLTFGVELVDAQRLIGTVELRVKSQIEAVGEIGYVLARPYWGQGYNLEAGAALLYYGFQVQRLRRIEARCVPQNRRSFRTLEKLGMRRVPLPVLPSAESVGSRVYLLYSLTSLEWMRHPLHFAWRHSIRYVA